MVVELSLIPVTTREASYESARAFILSVTPEDSETQCKVPLKSYTSSFGTLQVMESGSKELKMSLGKGLHTTWYDQIDDIRMPMQEYTSIYSRGLREKEKSSFYLLCKNIEEIERIFVDEDLVALEREIYIQLEKLGALKLFHACLARALAIPTTLNSHTELTKHSSTEGDVHDHVNITIVRSGKKEERKSRREKISKTVSKTSSLAPMSKSISKPPRRAIGSTVGSSYKSRSRRQKVVRNEAEMSRRVKDVADLEKIRTKLEIESGQVASFHSWAEAAGVDMKVLQQRLHYGWFCRDKLLRSTHSLVVYLARNYRGLGVSLEDLYQAGNMGVLKGAERFDHTRGYQFSTRINQIKKVRKTLYTLHGRYPDDDEISRFSGLSIAKIRFASQCLRIVGSVDQKVGDDQSAKFTSPYTENFGSENQCTGGFSFENFVQNFVIVFLLVSHNEFYRKGRGVVADIYMLNLFLVLKEFTVDTSIKSPEEVVMRQHMQKDLYELLQWLHPRESQVLVLRFGLWDGQCKSLQEIAKIFKCTKEWIRKIEKSALTKLRKEEVQRNLNQYINLQL
ncbi:hypothetical protein IFM89_013168 [Coptis chinensis]|uniref:Sigma factor n=1 Tax=Coptis chinensis TaxID=261450 RepID=A0A835I9W3_9MAGN|nr:hypothetical protein IFM89_013168 [Coptis chinensis]